MRAATESLRPWGKALAFALKSIHASGSFEGEARTRAFAGAAQAEQALPMIEAMGLPAPLSRALLREAFARQLTIAAKSVEPEPMSQAEIALLAHPEALQRLNQGKPKPENSRRDASQFFRLVLSGGA